MAKIHSESEHPEIHLSIQGHELDITPENTSYTQYIIGRVALGDVMRDADSFDHIRIRSDDDPDREDDIFIFRPDEDEYPHDAEIFAQFTRTLLLGGYPIYGNLTEVDDETLYAFQKKIDQDARENSKNLIDELTDFLDSQDNEDK